MATPTYIKGDGLLLYVHDGSAYVPIACLTQNSLSQTRNIIEAQTKCTPGLITKGAGSLTYEIGFEGLYIDTTSATGDTGKASHDKIKGWIEDGEIHNWKLDTGLTDTPAYFGESIFSDLELTAPAGDEFASFSGTMSGSGAILETDPITP